MGRIILDTNALYDPRALAELADLPTRAVLPAVAFAERVRQVLRRGGSLAEVWELLARFGITVEAFGTEEALQRTQEGLADERWARLARDAFIGGHVGPDDILWTNDVVDFLAVGVPIAQIRSL